MKEDAAREDKAREPRRRKFGKGGVVAIVAALIGTAVALIDEDSGWQAIGPFARGEDAVAASSKLDDRGHGVYARKPPCVHPPIDTEWIRGRARVRLRSGAKVGPAVNPLWGFYRNLARGPDLWVLVYVVGDERFYPQSDRGDEPAVLLPRRRSRRRSLGHFRSAAYFSAGPGATYEVIAVLARKKASRYLSSALRLWAGTGNYRGLTADEMPFGLDQKDCVTVHD